MCIGVHCILHILPTGADDTTLCAAALHPCCVMLCQVSLSRLCMLYWSPQHSRPPTHCWYVDFESTAAPTDTHRHTSTAVCPAWRLVWSSPALTPALTPCVSAQTHTHTHTVCVLPTH